MIEIIKTDQAPEALGHYSQATKALGFIYTATQLPMDPNDPNKPKGTIQEQASQVIDNIIQIVKAGGGDYNTIIRIHIYVSDTNYWNDINKVYEEKFKNHMPARGVLEIKNIRKGYDVSMDAIAVEK